MGYSAWTCCVCEVENDEDMFKFTDCENISLCRICFECLSQSLQNRIHKCINPNISNINYFNSLSQDKLMIENIILSDNLTFHEFYDEDGLESAIFEDLKRICDVCDTAYIFRYDDCKCYSES